MLCLPGMNQQLNFEMDCKSFGKREYISTKLSIHVEQ